MPARRTDDIARIIDDAVRNMPAPDVTITPLLAGAPAENSNTVVLPDLEYRLSSDELERMLPVATAIVAAERDGDHRRLEAILDALGYQPVEFLNDGMIAIPPDRERMYAALQRRN